MEHAVIENRLKLRSLKNRTLLRVPNYCMLQPADSSSKYPQDTAGPFCCKGALLTPAPFVTHQGFWGVLAELPSCPTNGVTPPQAALCTSLCWTLWGSCHSFVPQFPVLTHGTMWMPGEATQSPEQSHCEQNGQIPFTSKASAEGQCHCQIFWKNPFA